MEDSQTVLRLYDESHLSLALPGNTSRPGAYSVQWMSPVYHGAAHLVLLLAPSVILLLIFPYRVWHLRGASLKVLPNRNGILKLLLAIAIASVELTTLVLRLTSGPSPDAASIATNVVRFVASLAVCQLSFVEHGRSVRPSTLLTFYLLVSTISDAFSLPSIYLVHHKSSTTGLLTAVAGLKLILLILESLNKQGYLREPYQGLPIEQTVASLNRIFLFWVNGQILKGSSKLLSVSDLPSLDDALRSRELRTRVEAAWEKTTKPKADDKTKSAKAFLKAWFRCFGSSMLILAVPRLLLVACRFSQPILINRTIKYVSEPVLEFGDRQPESNGSQLIRTAFLIYAGSGIFFCIYTQGLNRLVVQTRGAFVGLIHTRCLTIRDGVYDDAAAVTHMSSDVDTVDYIPFLFLELLAQIVELSIGLAFLWNELGWWCLTPIIIVVLSSQSARTLGNRIGNSIMEWQMAKQKRIAITTSMIDYIKDIKMMGMAETVMARIQDSRLSDIAKGNRFRWIVGYLNCIVFSVMLFAPVITLVFYAIDARLRGQEALDPTKAFTAVAIISLVTVPANNLLVFLPQFGAMIGVARRIQGYLLEPSRDDKRRLIEHSLADVNDGTANADDQDGNSPTKGDSASVVLDGVSLRPAASANTCLEDATIMMVRGSLNVICGAVGTGKTTLARAVLGDVPPEKGTISVSSKRIGYCAQKPWLTNTSIKKIICGPVADADIDQRWYDTVIDACGLTEDVQHLANGDTATVGSRGVTLSGGQRQRVAIARALYARPSIIILDDVLSALDAKTENHVAEKLLSKDGIFRSLGTTVILITHATQHLPLADHIVVLAEKKVVEQGTWDELRTSTGYVSKLQVKELNTPSAHIAAAVKSPAVAGTTAPSNDILMDLTRKIGDVSVYWYFFQSAGLRMLVLFLVLNFTFGATVAATPSILRAWSESGGQNIWLYVSLYSLSAVVGFLSISGVIWSNFIKLTPKAGEVIHHKLLKTIMRAPISYFATTETGTIVNRFGQDISYVDDKLPFALLVVVLQTFRVLAQASLLAITQASLAICAPPVLFVLYFLQKLYLQTSRQIRFLDLESRAAVYSNFLETLEGITFIRALGWQSQSINQNIKRLDVSQTPHYMMKTIQLWLSLVLDLLVAGLAVLVVSLAVVSKSTTSGGQIGVALVVVMQISATLVRLLEQWTQLETSLGAVARIKSLEATLLPEDKEGENVEPPSEWPGKGAIEFRDVTAAYNPETIALDGISLSISPGQKVGICGRTGSGKSTLLLSILRLIELESGSIFIDGLDHSHLPRETIRSRLIAVPQETFILNDSIRLNIDPSGTMIDEYIIAALEKVRLWDVIKSRDDHSNGGTEAPAGSANPSDDPSKKKDEALDPLAAPLKSSPFSHGQFQLFGLARALLLKSRSTILILDEATSNVDSETDALMQRIIREEFSQHTILSIAHRLDTIRDSDLIVVLDKGKVVETGAPDELLAKKQKEQAADGEADPNQDAHQDSADEKAWFRELWEGSH